MKKNWKDIKTNWEIKPRTYVLTGEAAPPLRQIRTKHLYDNHLLWFDEESGTNKELRYAANVQSPFVDEQPEKGVRIEHIFFKEGYLFTDREQVIMQQFLEIHPDNGKIFVELKPEADAEEEVIDFEKRADAYEVVKGLDLDGILSVMFSEIGDEVFKTSTKELKRDVYVIADEDPKFLVDLVEKESTMLKWIARKAVKFGILTLSGDKRIVKWGKGTKKICSIPVDKNTYAGIADFFMTDDGIEIKAKVLEKLKDFE